MWQFGVLAGLLVGGATLIGLYMPGVFSLAAWFTAGVLLLFGFAGLGNREATLKTEKDVHS